MADGLGPPWMGALGFGTVASTLLANRSVMIWVNAYIHVKL